MQNQSTTKGQLIGFGIALMLTWLGAFNAGTLNPLLTKAVVGAHIILMIAATATVLGRFKEKVTHVTVFVYTIVMFATIYVPSQPDVPVAMAIAGNVIVLFLLSIKEIKASATQACLGGFIALMIAELVSYAITLNGLVTDMRWFRITGILAIFMCYGVFAIGYIKHKLLTGKQDAKRLQFARKLTMIGYSFSILIMLAVLGIFGFAALANFESCDWKTIKYGLVSLNAAVMIGICAKNIRVNRRLLKGNVNL